MRRLVTNGMVVGTEEARRWAYETSRVTRVARGVYAKGPGMPTALDRACAVVLRRETEARGHLAGVLHGLDSVVLDDRPTRRARLSAERVVLVDGDTFIARVDLSKPDDGYFLELDGEHHEGQPVYDAVRQTNVVSVTGMLPGRFTWTEVTRMPNTTRRRLAVLAAQARALRAR